MANWTPGTIRLSGSLASELRALERREKMRPAPPIICRDCGRAEPCYCDAYIADVKADMDYACRKNGDCDELE